MRQARFGSVLVAMALVWALSSGAQRIVFTSPPQSVRLGLPSAPLTLQRLAADGGVIGPGAPALSVDVLSSSSTGQFARAPDPYAAWSSTFQAQIAADASTSAPFYYRDVSVGTVTLVADAGTGWSPGLQAEVVSAQSLVDDVESGTLLASDTPAGQWTERIFPTMGNTLAASPAAAHRGGFGVRLVDGDSTSGPGSQDNLDLVVAPIVGELHLRFWFRVSGSNELGEVLVAQLLDATRSNGEVCDVDVLFPGAHLRLAGVDGAHPYSVVDTGIQLASGRWYLVECGVTGLGTAAGTRTLWVDGVQVAAQAGRDWTGWRVNDVELGEPWADDRSFTGTLDFDDIRTAGAPQADRLAVGVSDGSRRVGDCIPLTISLQDAAHAPAAAAYDVAVTLAVTGLAAEIHGTNACRSPVSSVAIPRGASEASFYLHATGAGIATLSASHVDFLPGTGLVTVATVGMLKPPAFISKPSKEARCGMPYRYSDEGVPRVRGDGPFTFSVEGVDGGAPPAGLEVDPATGEIHWTPPPSQSGTVSAQLRVTGPGGTDVQPLDVSVECPPLALGVGCGCDSTGPGAWLALVAAMGLWRARSR